jgi:DNA-binding transcriptional LysR family regulator
MDLRQLAALVAVAEHGSFSAAADALHTVQSNVSAHVARLERELGTVLFDRAARRLTAEGEAVVARAWRIQGELDALASDVAAIRHDVAGTVHLGMIGTTARWLVPRLLDAVATRYRGVTLVIVDATSSSLTVQLRNGRLDLAVVNLPLEGDDIVAEPLFTEELLVVAPTTHPLARRRSVRLADLAGHPLLLPARGTAFRGELDEAAAAEGVTLQAQAEVDGVRLLASLAFQGHGAAIVPASGAPSELQGPWVSVPLVGAGRRTVAVAQRRRGMPSAAAKAVHGLLFEQVRHARSLPFAVQPVGPDAGP